MFVNLAPAYDTPTRQLNSCRPTKYFCYVTSVDSTEVLSCRATLFGSFYDVTAQAC